MSHLGGHLGRTNLDSGVIQFLKEKFKAQSFIDIGCGTGGMVQEAINQGLDAYGIEGDPETAQQLTEDLKSKITIHDYTVGPDPFTQVFDIGYSCEFLEHVEEKFQDNYMKTFEKCKWIVVTAAPTHWPGVHHVNCRSLEYWIRKFGERGLLYSQELSELCRKESSMGLDRPFAKQFMKNRGIFFYNARYLNKINFQSINGHQTPSQVFGINKKYFSIVDPTPIKLKKVKHLFKSELPSITIHVDTKEELIDFLNQPSFEFNPQAEICLNGEKLETLRS